MQVYDLLMLFASLLIPSVRCDKWGTNNRIDLTLDMSTICIDDLQMDIYLPYGMGVADASVIIISDNDFYPNCLLTFFTGGADGSMHIIIVVEFPDRTEGTKNACQDVDSKIYIKEPGVLGEIDVCYEVNELSFGYYDTPVYTLISNSNNVTVGISSKSLFETVKVTATSARGLNKYEECNGVKETMCSIGNLSVCINKELLCDGNINCGSIFDNDEDVRICDETRYKKLWLVVLSGTIMIMILAFFFIHLLCSYVPTVPDSFFIFNEDEDNKLILSSKFTNSAHLQCSFFKFKNIPVICKGETEPYASGHREESTKRVSLVTTVSTQKNKTRNDELNVIKDKDEGTKRPRFQSEQ